MLQVPLQVPRATVVEVIEASIVGSGLSDEDAQKIRDWVAGASHIARGMTRAGDSVCPAAGAGLVDFAQHTWPKPTWRFAIAWDDRTEALGCTAFQNVIKVID